MKKLLETTLNAVRNMALLLRPSMLDDFGLAPALEWHAREVGRRTGIRVQVDAEDVPDEFSEELKTCAYRIVQEALHNAARHAGARNIRIVVRRYSGRLTVEVKDDGKGFDTRRTRGLGLLGMEERVRNVGGSLEVESFPGRGTRIAAELPLDHGLSIEART